MSGRILFFASSLGSYVVMTYYACDLTSIMTLKPAEAPIKSFFDALQRGYTLMVQADTFHESYLSAAQPGSPMRELYMSSKAMGPTMPESDDRALDLLLAKTESKMLIFTNTITYVGNRLVTHLKLDNMYSGALGFGLRRHSEFTELFNYHLKIMDEGGVGSRIRTYWLDVLPEGAVEQESNPLGYENLFFLFCVVGIGAAVGVVAAILERIISCMARCIRRWT